MKPDKFDEAIRRKLEGIQPSFQEDDWSKFTAYQAAHTSQPFFQRFSGRTAWYTAASVATAMMVFANVYQYQKNKKLDREVVELKANIAKQKDAPVRVTTRVDTVYITKYIEVKSSQLPPYDATVPSLNDEISDTFERTPRETSVANEVLDEGANNEVATNAPDSKTLRQRANEVDSKSTSNSIRSTRENEVNSVRGSNYSEVLSRNNLGRNNSNQQIFKESVSIKNSSSLSQKTTLKQLPKTNSYEPTGRPQTETQGQSKEEIRTVSEPEEIAFLEPHTEIEELAGITPAAAKVERYAYTILSNPSNTATSARATNTSSSAAAPPPPSISFKTMKFRIGVGLNIGDKLTSYSAHTSLLLGKFWSLNVGIAKTYVTGPQYYTEDIFKAKTQRDFREWNKKEPIQSPMAPPQAFNISTNASLWQMPVSLTYRWPVKDGFTFLLSGGTNLNLYTSQKFSYFIRERNGEIEEKEGKFTLKPSLSNSIIAAAGVEKQWKNLVGQAETYIAPYVQKPSYLTENRNIGIRFKVLYQFGKKSI